ncbi:MAG: S8 family serine peptidase [Firmicutes bacterium]|nr:S8 family serine peptidase [Bacillota bacterium]
MRRSSKFIAVMVAIVMAITSFAMPVLAAPVGEYAQLDSVVDRSATVPVQLESMVQDEEIDFLLSTLNEPPVGMVGFEGPYCIEGYNNEIIGITVMFRTPPAVALRLIEEAANPRTRMGRNADQMFVSDALAAHDAFSSQLGVLPVPFGTAPIEVVGYHYMLFNGVFLNVPASMVETIAALPEVFAVTPSFVYFTAYELSNMSEEQWMARERLPLAYVAEAVQAESSYPVIVTPDPFYIPQGESVGAGIGTINIPVGALILSNASSINYITVEHSNTVVANGGNYGHIPVYIQAFCENGYYAPVGLYSVAMAAVFFDGTELVTAEVTLTINVTDPVEAGPYVPHPEFNLGAKELFDIPYIHETLGLTGAGIRVGVLDTGIDYRHPVFAQYLVPTDRYTPGLGYYTLRGGNFMVEPAAANRETGRGTSPMENNHGGHTNHGTHVAGTIVAMAPDIQLYGFRVLSAAPGGIQPANSVTRAVEYAYYLGLDVINLSIQNRVNSPFQALTFSINIASMAGMVSSGAAGNDALAGAGPRMPLRGGWYSLSGGAAAAALGISVAAGEAGGRHTLGSEGSEVNGNPTDINLVGMARDGWSPEDMDGDYDYVWFGMLTLPPGGRTNPAFPAFVQEIAENHLDGGDLSGRVAIINRGGGEFVTMMDMAHELNAVALVVVNNTADNSHLIGTVLNNPNQPIPAYSLRREAGLNYIGPPTPPPVPGLTGTINFGTVITLSSPDVLASFSSVGPLGPLNIQDHPAAMHIKPDIVGPGVNVLSANNIQHPTLIDGGHYTLMGGTSMSAPAVAGIAALMLQQFPNANPLEIRSRMMSTARPLTGYEGQYSVLQVGAGFIDPIRALTERSFITTRHAVPFAPDTSGWGAPDTGEVIGFEGGWSYQDMSSLSFGRVSMEYGEPASTVVIPVTIRNSTVGSRWTVDYSLLMPTQQLAPPDGNWQLWGPPLDHTVTGVTVEIQEITGHMFAVRLTHDGNVANRGFAQGYLTFTQGDVVLTTPFGAYFDIPVPPAPLEPHPNNVIWRPIISNWVNTPTNADETDPRAFRFAAPSPGWWFPNDTGIITRSNYSSLAFGFTDPNNGPARPVRFYYAPYGYGIGDAIHFSGAILAPGTFTHYFSVVRAIKGGSSFGVAAGLPAGVYVIENGTILDAGVYTLFVRVVHGAGEDYDLLQEFTFVVTDEKPGIDLTYETFYFAEGDEYVTITGNVLSLGHELAMEYNVTFMPTWPLSIAAFDLSNVELWLDNTGRIPVNADGSFSFEVPVEEESFTISVTDGLGFAAIPPGNVMVSANMVSALYSFDVALADDGPQLCEYCNAYPCECPEYPVFSFDIFNNGEGGSPSRPNQNLADLGIIRMWTQLNGVNTPVHLTAADTIEALDQNGYCAEDFLRIGRVWQEGTGWLDYFNLVDVDKDGGSWQYINLSITVNGEIVDVLLVNAKHVCTPPTYFDCVYCEDAGCVECGPELPTFYLTASTVTVSNANRHVSVFFGGTAEGAITVNLLDNVPELLIQVRDNLWTPTGNVDGLVIGVAGNSAITESGTVTLEVTRDGVTALLLIELVAE